jgi:hypothetical protein
MVKELETLDLSDQFVSDSLLRRIPKDCPSLININLSGSFSTVTDSALESLLKKLPTVRVIMDDSKG